MGSVTTEIFVVFMLLIANGIFAMAEIALLSSRKARLQQRAEGGNRKAAVALALANDPNDFLSTVQVGITLVGILAGAFGGASIAEKITLPLNTVSWIDPHGEAVAMTLVVVAITYFSLIIGELVPKRIALTNPEGIASAMAPSMRTLSRLALPAVRLLSISSEIVLKIFRIRESKEQPITEDELRLLIRQGTKAGTFEVAEQQMVERVFEFGDRSIGSLMTPRPEIVWIDARRSADEIAHIIGRDPHDTFPVAEDSLDHLIGVLSANDLLVQVLTGNPIDVRKLIHPVLMLPEGMTARQALDAFKQHGSERAAIVIDEYGGVEGLLTLDDLVSQIVGHGGDPLIAKREDGSWLVDGTVTTAELSEYFGLMDFSGPYLTVGGFVMTEIGRIPKTSDHFDWGQFRFEVIDMDRNRVDKVLMVRRAAGTK